MTEHKLSDEQALGMLHEEVKWLKETITSVDHDVARVIKADAMGITPSKGLVARIQAEYEVKQDLTYKLGRTSVHVEQLTERIEQQRVRDLEEQRQAETFAVLENHLDWLEVDMRQAADSADEGQRQDPVSHDPERLNRGTTPQAEAAMDDRTTELESLRKHGLALKTSIKGVNRDLDRALQAVAAGKTGRALRILEIRFREYAELMFELGKVTEHMRMLRGQTREQVHEPDGRDWNAERKDDWQAQVPVGENFLDWLPPLPEEPEPGRDERHPMVHGEERLPEDRQRDGPQPEDELDWLQDQR